MTGSGRRRLNPIYQRIVRTFTEYIAGELELNSRERGRIRYGLELLLSDLITISLAIAVAALIGNLPIILYLLASGAVLKGLSGGIHLRTPGECAIFSFPALPLVEQQNICYH